MTRLREIDRRLLAPGSNHLLGCVRVGLAVVLGLRAAVGPYRALAGQPAALFDPPWWIAVGVDRMPSTAVIVAIQVLAVVAAIACVSGRAPRAGFAGAWLGLLVLAGLRGSLGKVLHNDVLLLLCAVPVLFAPAVARPGARGRSAASGWPWRGALAVCGAVYFFTGFQKLRHTGLDWVFSDNMRWVLYAGAASGRAPTTVFARAIADQAWLATVTAAWILLLELTAPLWLAIRRTRLWFLAAVTVLHVGTWLTLGLDYWAWVLTVAVLVAPWDELPLVHEPAAEGGGRYVEAQSRRRRLDAGSWS
jgi:hypothetical protein